jgi:hypothetical protein
LYEQHRILNFNQGPVNQGPVKSDDELRPAEMNYGRRKEVTDALTGKFVWFDSVVSLEVQ